MWRAIKRKIASWFSQPSQNEVALIPLTEEERIANGQQITGDSTFQKIILFSSVAGATEYLFLLLAKVFAECSEENKQDEDCIESIDFWGSILAYSFGLLFTLIQPSLARLPNIKRDVEIFLDVFFKYPFIFQVFSYLVGSAIESVRGQYHDEPLPRSTSAISDTAINIITVLYTTVALIIALITNHRIRQNILAWCCGLPPESALTNADFRRNVNLDPRGGVLHFIDMGVFQIGEGLINGRGIASGIQDMVAALRCKSRSIYFSAGYMRWIVAAFYALPQAPFAIINHPLKPIEFRSKFEKSMAIAEQFVGLAFFCATLLVSIVAAFICDEDKSWPLIKLLLYLNAFAIITLFANCIAPQSGHDEGARDEGASIMSAETTEELEDSVEKPLLSEPPRRYGTTLMDQPITETGEIPNPEIQISSASNKSHISSGKAYERNGLFANKQNQSNGTTYKLINQNISLPVPAL